MYYVYIYNDILIWKIYKHKWYNTFIYYSIRFFVYYNSPWTLILLVQSSLIKVYVRTKYIVK